MGQSASSARVQRSSVKDTTHHVTYCLEELSKWEDGAALVRELLQTDLRHPSATLAAFGGPSTPLLAGVGATTSGAGTPRARTPEIGAETPREHAAREEAGFDGEAYRTLLHSVDEVLRQGQSKEYFKSIPHERLEHIMTSPASSFILPPSGISKDQSSSRLFAVAALQSILEQQQESGAGGPSWTQSLVQKLKGEGGTGLHKRLSEDVYGGVSTGEEETAELEKEKPEEEEVETGRTHGFEAPREAALGQEREETGGVAHRLERPPALGVPSHEVESKRPSHEHVPITEALYSAAATGSEESTLETLENQRAVVCAKYLFISNFLDTLTRTAEFNYKAAVRLGSLKRQFKQQKAFSELPLVQQHRMRKTAEVNSHRLERGLIAFDRARMTLGWLLHNYAIGAASFKVNAAIVNLKSLMRDLRSERGHAVGLSAAEKERQFNEGNMFMHWFDRRHVQLLLEQQANERDALSIGAIFLDGNLDGHVEVTELADFSAKLFQQIDTKRRGRFSHIELQSTVDSLCHKIETMQNRIHHLKVENDRLADRATDSAAYQFEKNTDELKALEHNLVDPLWSLRSIYSYFHRSFVAHVFPRIRVDARISGDLSQYASIPFLQKQLEQLEERRSRMPLDEEIKMGKYRSRITHPEEAELGPAESGRTPQQMLFGERGGKKKETFGPEREEERVKSTEEWQRQQRQKEEELKQQPAGAALTALPVVSGGRPSESEARVGMESGAGAGKPSFSERLKEGARGLFGKEKEKEKESAATTRPREGEKIRETFHERPRHEEETEAGVTRAAEAETETQPSYREQVESTAAYQKAPGTSGEPAYAGEKGAALERKSPLPSETQYEKAATRVEPVEKYDVGAGAESQEARVGEPSTLERITDSVKTTLGMQH